MKKQIKKLEDGLLNRFYTRDYILSLKGKKRKLLIIDNWNNMKKTQKEAKEDEEEFSTQEDFDFDINNYCLCQVKTV